MSTERTGPRPVPAAAGAALPEPAARPAAAHTAPDAASPRDQVFAARRARIEDFHFGRETAAVFDDMLDRSVPFYTEIQRMVAELAADFAVSGSRVVDLGCSTCTSFLHIDAALPPGVEVQFLGIDNSPEMLARGAAKLEQQAFARPYELACRTLEDGVAFDNASVVLLVLTLQFVRPLHRERLVQSIRDGMNDDGCLIVVEKVLGESSTFNRLFIKHYYEMKRRNGYSEMEIAQKREALENVLIPYRLEENKQLLTGAGFRSVDVFFKWYNFCGILARK